MNIALVHDQLNEFGGAERVLLALSELYPTAPIYTAYCKKGSPAWERFKHKDIRVSWVQHIPGFVARLHSPLRFLAPLIWNSFDFSSFDIVIGSSSWYVTKGFTRKRQGTGDKRQGKTVEICYCHTPPRWLYGYPTSVNWQRYPIVRAYAAVVGFFMRQYDYAAAQRVDYFIANSKETQRRIAKFYRRESTVVYPPINVIHDTQYTIHNTKQYYLFVSRDVGGKGLELAIEAAKTLKFSLKIVGRTGQNDENIEYLGIVSDEELATLYADAKAFLALATNEDFGMTPVEAMSCGTPVIAYDGGGYSESVIDGKTGILFNESTSKDLSNAIQRFEHIKRDWRRACLHHAHRFAKERFFTEIQDFVNTHKIK